MFDQIGICTGYRLPDREIRHVPALLDELEGASPNLEFLPGWLSDTTEARRFAALPQNLLEYIERLESHLGAPVRYVGVGPDREQLIDRQAG